MKRSKDHLETSVPRISSEMMAVLHGFCLPPLRKCLCFSASDIWHNRSILLFSNYLKIYLSFLCFSISDIWLVGKAIYTNAHPHRSCPPTSIFHITFDKSWIYVWPLGKSRHLSSRICRWRKTTTNCVQIWANWVGLLPKPRLMTVKLTDTSPQLAETVRNSRI